KFEECKRCKVQQDYLNEILLCNSCCKKLERRAPNGYQPNLKFEQCRRCNIQQDYLNEFLICNSCCQQLTQMIPAGFRPNFKFEKCKGRCNQPKDYLNEFKECNLCERCKRCYFRRKNYYLSWIYNSCSHCFFELFIKISFICFIIVILIFYYVQILKI